MLFRRDNTANVVHAKVLRQLTKEEALRRARLYSRTGEEALQSALRGSESALKMRQLRSSDRVTHSCAAVVWRAGGLAV